MTDEINITGKPGSRANNPLGLDKNPIRGAKLRAGFIKQGSLSEPDLAIDPNVFNSAALQNTLLRQRNRTFEMKLRAAESTERLRASARAADTSYRNDYTLASRMNADVNARNRASARAADTSYRNDYALASRMNADVNARNRASARAVDAGYRNDYALASRMNADKDAAYKRTPMYSREQEFGRLGRRGAQATNNGELKELIRIDRHLAKMDKTLDKYTKANIHNAPEREAALIRARQTLAGAYSQVSAGAEGAPGLKGFLMRAVVQRRAARARDAAGGGYGGGGGGKRGGLGGMKDAAMGMLGDGLEGLGVVGDVLGPIGIGIGVLGAAAYEAYKVPAQISNLYNSAYDTARPFIDLKRNAGFLGLAGGLNGRNLLRRFNGSKSGSWEGAYGLSPQSSMRMLLDYGIVPKSAASAQNTVQYMAGLRYKGAFAGMGDKSYEDIARQQSIFNLSRTENTKQLERLFTDATSKGLSRASVLQTTNALLRQIAASGGMTNSGGAAIRLARTAMASGLSGGRNGALALSAGAQLASTYANLGTNPVTSMPIVSFIEQHGGRAHSLSALKAQLDNFAPGSFETAEKTSAGRRMISSMIAPGNNMYTYLRQFSNIENAHKGALARNAQHWGRVHAPSPALVPFYGSAAAGETMPNYYGSTRAIYPNPNALHGKYHIPFHTFMSAIHHASVVTGVPEKYLYGIGSQESDFGKNVYNPLGGAAGPLQNTPGSANRHFHYLTSMQNIKHPKRSAVESAKIFAHDWALFNGRGLSEKQHYLATLALFGGWVLPGGNAVHEALNGQVQSGFLTYGPTAWATAQSYDAKQAQRKTHAHLKAIHRSLETAHLHNKILRQPIAIPSTPASAHLPSVSLITQLSKLNSANANSSQWLAHNAAGPLPVNVSSVLHNIRQKEQAKLISTDNTNLAHTGNKLQTAAGTLAMQSAKNTDQSLGKVLGTFTSNAEALSQNFSNLAKETAILVTNFSKINKQVSKNSSNMTPSFAMGGI